MDVICPGCKSTLDCEDGYYGMVGCPSCGREFVAGVDKADFSAPSFAEIPIPAPKPVANDSPSTGIDMVRLENIISEQLKRTVVTRVIDFDIPLMSMVKLIFYFIIALIVLGIIICAVLFLILSFFGSFGRIFTS